MAQTILALYQQTLAALEKTGEYACFAFADTSIGLYCDNSEVIEWLSQYFTGYVVLSKQKNVDITLYSTQDLSLFNALYSQKEHATLVNEKYGQFEMELDEQTTLILGKDTEAETDEQFCYIRATDSRRFLMCSAGTLKTFEMMVMDMARSLTKLLLCEKGWIPVHAAAFVKDGTGVAMVGGRLAGKTSVLLNLLAQPGAKFVNNDKLFLRDAGTHLEAYGVPGVGLRIGTVLSNPRLRRWIDLATDSFYEQISSDQLRTIAETTPAVELRNRKEKIKLTSWQAANLLEIPIESRITLESFLVVNYSPELEEARLLPLEKEELLTYLTPHFRQIAKKQKFLYAFFDFDFDTDILHQRIASMLEKFAPQLAIQELQQNERTNEQTEKLVDQLIRSLSTGLRERA